MSIPLQRLAIDVRQTLLEGVTPDIALSLYVQLEDIKKKLASPFQRFKKRSVAERFALNFLRSVNPLDNRFLCSIEKYADAYPWKKRYEEFLHYQVEQKTQKEYLQNVQNALPLWFPTPPANLKISLAKIQILRGFLWYLELEHFEYLQENRKTLFLLSEKQFNRVSFNVFRYLWKRSHNQSRSSFLQVNHQLASLNPSIFLEYMRGVVDGENSSQSRDIIQNPQYLEAERFIKRTPPDLSTGKGIFVDLDMIVEKVRCEQFPEMKTAPTRQWLSSYATRKLAHYDSGRDQICFSLIFDMPDVDHGMLNFIAYHELLHRVLGTKIINGRTRAHTQEFRRKEHSYPSSKYWEQSINEYLKK